MRLLFVGDRPETHRLVASFVEAGIASVVHRPDETGAMLTIEAGRCYDWILAEADAAGSLERNLRSRYALATPVVYLDWTREPAQALRLHPEIGVSSLSSLVADSEAQWVLEYHIHRGKDPLA